MVLKQYPCIYGVDPLLLNETGVAGLTEYSYPEYDTYLCRGVYKFSEHGVTVTIKPHLPNEKLKNWHQDPKFDLNDITEPDGWKIMVSSSSNPLLNDEGDHIYNTPDEAVSAIRNAENEELSELKESLES